MFGTVKRIIDWCGSFKKNLYIGFVFSFFSGWFAAMPVIWAAYTIGKLVECEGQGRTISADWIWKSIVIQLLFIFLRFLFDYLRARFQESISYELIARDRLAVGDALKRVSLGYFQNMNTGTILNSITTGLHTLEGMGIRMIDNFVGGYLNFICILLWLTCVKSRADCSNGCHCFPDIPVHHFKVQYKKCTNPCCGKQGADRSNPGIRERTFCSEILWKSRSFYGVNEKSMQGQP